MIAMRAGVVCLVVAAAAPSARAQADDETLDQRWPSVPESHLLTLEDQIVDHLSELGNALGGDLDRLSHDLIDLRVDGRHQRARLRVGGGDLHYLTFSIDTAWHFADGKAHIQGHLDVGVKDHLLRVVLPEMDLVQDSYRGERLVQVNVPLIYRRF